MPTIHLVEGPIGAGKSTYAIRLAQRGKAPYICLDEWIAALFLPDRPASASVDWYLDRKARCEAQIWRTACQILEAGHDVILELGLLTRANRAAFYRNADEAGFEVRLHVVDAPASMRRERVRLRNLERGDTWTVDITDAMFERSNGWWEPPGFDEYAAHTIVDITGA